MRRAGRASFRLVTWNQRTVAFFFNKVNMKSYWVGVSKKSEEPPIQWVDMNLDVIPDELLVWAPTEPGNRWQVDEKYVSANDSGLSDYSFYQYFEVFLCEFL